jgi:predicted  nucleic acid-binding Zn-ribbon protein
MAKKMTKSSQPAKKAALPKKAVAKKAVKEAKKSAPVKKKNEEKAKPVSKNKATVAKSAIKPAAKNLKAPAKKIVKKAMPEKKASKAPAKKAVAKKAVTTVPAKKAAKAAPAEKSAPVVKKSAPVKKAAPVTSKKEIAVSKKPVKPIESKVEVVKAAAPVATATPVTKPEVKKKEVKAAKAEVKPAVEETLSDRPKPRIIEYQRDHKPTANPVFVVNPEGMAPVKFAPVARIEKNEKKESEDMKSTNRFAFVEGENKASGVTIENKLRALYDVQLIDSRIDKIHATRGELPLEVEDLENEVAGLTIRVGKVQDEVNAALEDVAAKKQGIKDAETQIKKYKENLEKVKNNREYEALNKEIEFQELEIQLFKKKIREGEVGHEAKLASLEASQQKLEARTNDLEFKKKQLQEIVAETEREEDILKAKSAEAKKMIDQRLLDAYERIRKGANNGLAVVPIDREASAGSFIHIPPQKQMDVAARKKVIIDEHSGRILVDGILAYEQAEKINQMLEKELKK